MKSNFDSTSFTLSEINKPIISNISGTNFNVQTLPQLNPLIEPSSRFGSSTNVNVDPRKICPYTGTVRELDFPKLDPLVTYQNYSASTKMQLPSPLIQNSAPTNMYNQDQQLAFLPAAAVGRAAGFVALKYLEGKADDIILKETHKRQEEKNATRLPQLYEANPMLALNDVNFLNLSKVDPLANINLLGEKKS